MITDFPATGEPAHSPEGAAQAALPVSRLAPGAPQLEVRASGLLVRRLGLVDYQPAWEAMRAFTAARTAPTPDELWLLEHTPVYTAGVAARLAHLPRIDNGIAVVKSDRGGQITYHGPGQIVLYALVDLRRRGLTVRELVGALEQAVLDLLANYRVQAQRRAGAPGVYVGNAKIAALGLRVSRGCSYHGLSLNVDLDLEPFLAIDPCGYPGLAVTRTADLGVRAGTAVLGEQLIETVETQLGAPA